MKKVGQIRPEFVYSSQLRGREIEIVLPTGEKRKSQFAIVDLDNIIPSHNFRSFASSKGYPTTPAGENINDRNYSRDESAQAAVKGYAQNLTPSLIITTSRDESGTPIISTDGFVVSGNNRTMSLKLAAADFPSKYQEYKNFLIEEAGAYGFTEDQVLDFEGQGYKPVLVRYDYDFPEYNTLEMSKYNKGSMKSEKALDKVIKLSAILEASTRCNEVIANIVGQFDTFSDFYRVKSDQKKLANALVDCNILTTSELPAYYDNNVFTKVGKDFLENLLAAMVLSKNALIAAEEEGVKEFRNHIIVSLPILIKNHQLKNGGLREQINEAIVLQQKIKSSGLSFKDYMAQTSLFGETVNPKAAYINRLLSKGRNVFKSSIDGYNTTVIQTESSAGLFGDNPTPDEAFEHWIVGAIDPQEKAQIEFLSPENRDKEKAAARARARIRILELSK